MPMKIRILDRCDKDPCTLKIIVLNEFKVIIVHFVSLLLLYYYLHCLFVLIFRLSLS